MSIRIRNLSLSPGNKPLFNSLRADFPKGKIHALCGPNGSGKSQLLDAIAGIRQQYPEQIMWDTVALQTDQVAYIEQRARLYNNMTGKDYLKFLGLYHGGLSDSLLRAFDLPLELSLDTYSYSMIYKLRLIGALGEDKDVVLLDEPFACMDDDSIAITRNLLHEFIDKQKVFVIAVSTTSHLQDCCDSLHILQKGRIEESSISKTFSYTQ